MSLAALSKRLAVLEARRGPDWISGLCNLAGHPVSLTALAVRDWRAWVASGRARRNGSTLILPAPRLTATEWSARYAPNAASLR